MGFYFPFLLWYLTLVLCMTKGGIIAHLIIVGIVRLGYEQVSRTARASSLCSVGPVPRILARTTGKKM